MNDNTVRAVLSYYRNQHLPELGKRTQKDRLNYIKKLTEVFGAMNAANLQPHHIARYLEQHPSPVTANREIAVLSVAYRKAMRIGMVNTNPCAGVEKNKEKPRDRYVTDEEFLAVKSLCDPWLQAVMDLAYITGMRLGDLLTLEHRQIDEDGIHLKQSKTGAKQIIERTPALDDVLARLKKHRPVSGMYVVCTQRGQPYSTYGFSSIWRKRRDAALAEEKITETFKWHDIRAKSATDAQEQGLDAQRLLGHTTPEQTRAYLRSKQVARVRPLNPRAASDKS